MQAFDDQRKAAAMLHVVSPTLHTAVQAADCADADKKATEDRKKGKVA